MKKRCKTNESYLQSSLLVMYFLVRMVTEPSTMVLATSLQKYTIEGVAISLYSVRIFAFVPNLKIESACKSK